MAGDLFGLDPSSDVNSVLWHKPNDPTLGFVNAGQPELQAGAAATGTSTSGPTQTATPTATSTPTATATAGERREVGDVPTRKWTGQSEV